MTHPVPVHDADPHPATQLSVEAQAWLAHLPAPVRAHGIATHAPELANSIAACWNDMPSTETLLETLLCESVPTLPVAIAAELLRLYDYHMRSRVHAAPDTSWELPAVDMSAATEIGRAA
jgi:hypothetical protein